MPSDLPYQKRVLAAASLAEIEAIYAEWLGAQEGPRKELAAIQDALRRIDVPNREAIEKRMQELLRERVAPLAVTDANSIGMEFILVRPGEFIMGTPEWDRDAILDEMPQHPVTIDTPFFLGVYAVTAGQYVHVKGEDPSSAADPRCPVTGVTWFDSVRFCNLLSEREGYSPCYEIRGEDVQHIDGTGYRLPTEAEWEYACRAGTSTLYSFGNRVSLLKEYAEYAGFNPLLFPLELFLLVTGLRFLYPMKIEAARCGTKLSNPWGFYDMHGNVYEWCEDLYAAYSAAPATARPPVDDPEDAIEDSARVMRGGAYTFPASEARSASRAFLEPELSTGIRGFRVVREWCPG